MSHKKNHCCLPHNGKVAYYQMDGRDTLVMPVQFLTPAQARRLGMEMIAAAALADTQKIMASVARLEQAVTRG